VSAGLGGVLPPFSSILCDSCADGIRSPPALFAHFKSSICLCASILLGAALLLLPSPAQAQYTQQAELPATSPIGEALAGDSVALSADGNTALMGGFNDNSGAGAVWSSVRRNGVWTQTSKFSGNTFASEIGPAGLGNSVSMSADGATFLAGGPFDNGDTGAAWVVFSNFSNHPAKLVGTGAVGAANQGTSVAMSGDGNTIIVGGPFDNSNAGAAWIFTLSGGVWTQQGVLVMPTAGIAAAVTLTRVHIDQNSGSGLIADGTNGSGLIQVAVGDGSASLNAGNRITVTSALASVTMDVIRTTIAANGSAGLRAQGGAATVTVGSSQIRGNAVGLKTLGGGVLLSYGNNQMTGNGTNGFFSTTGLQ
jgi:hypothetical protein